jgi:hypothetical protein
MFISRSARRALLPLLAIPLTLALRPDAPHQHTRMARLPTVTLWSWERREDLRNLDSHRYAIAALDQTLAIGLNVHTVVRRNPVLLPTAATRIAVVRIEPASHAVFNAVNREAAVQAILVSARQPHIAALQVDFDATASQRAFYRDLLVELRQTMPPLLPLSITALASWCSYDDWLRSLPVDEAVPMMFRMEPDRGRGLSGSYNFAIREPLCLGSVGVSTSEPWPAHVRGKRIYIFADQGWQSENTAALLRRVQ